MLIHPLPLLVPMQNLMFCLEVALDKSPYETTALIHLNATANLAENIYGQLRKDRPFAWMRFNMNNDLTLENHMLKEILVRNMFFIYLLDGLVDWIKVYEFIMKTQLNYRDNQIYVVNKHADAAYIKKILDYTYAKGCFNSVFLFLNTSGKGHGMEAYICLGFRIRNCFVKMPLTGDQCGRDFYDKVFSDKTKNFNNQTIIIFGQTDPPKVLKTVATVHGHNKHSIGGEDVFITETLFRHLNASAVHIIVANIALFNSTRDFLQVYKPENNTEQRIFKVSQIMRLKWGVPKSAEALRFIHRISSIEINAQQMRYAYYMETLRFRLTIYLYPHDTDNFILIVPRRYKMKTEYDQMLKSPLILVWTPAVAIVGIMRFIFNKIRKTDKKLADIFLETFGLSLGMSFGATISNAAENLLLWCFCLGTMLSGMLLSSEMFQGFSLQLDILAINNLEELEKSGMEVRVPMDSESVQEHP